MQPLPLGEIQSYEQNLFSPIEEADLTKGCVDLSLEKGIYRIVLRGGNGGSGKGGAGGTGASLTYNFFLKSDKQAKLCAGDSAASIQQTSGYWESGAGGGAGSFLKIAEYDGNDVYFAAGGGGGGASSDSYEFKCSIGGGGGGIGAGGGGLGNYWRASAGGSVQGLYAGGAVSDCGSGAQSGGQGINNGGFTVGGGNGGKGANVTCRGKTPAGLANGVIYIIDSMGDKSATTKTLGGNGGYKLSSDSLNGGNGSATHFNNVKDPQECASGCAKLYRMK
jgi:hypothetical protein